jgi:glutamate-1-semialdehyde aminotransferase/spore coat polysaccharide biosynthesis protein SpsF (cytidylyltransferase family)
MNKVAIIQARMGSTRFPKKMTELLGDKPLIWHVIHQIGQAKLVDKIVLATSDNRENDVLIQEARNCGIDYFAGDEDDVLDRFTKCAKTFQADLIIRITGDCPFTDPELIDAVISLFDRTVDFASNTHPPTYPDGMDVEVFSFSALERSWKEAHLKSEREHVTSHLWTNPQIFKCVNLENARDLSSLRLTVDEREDLGFLNEIFKRLKTRAFHLRDILDVLDRNPELLAINSQFRRNEGYEKSLKEDVGKDRSDFFQSGLWLEKAKKIIPSASQTYSKSYKYFSEGAGPAFLDHGQGGHVWDIDGNEYLDFVLGLGAVTVGYHDEDVDRAVVEQLKKGISFSQPTLLEVKLAQKLTEIIPCAEMVRFVKNGSDATTATIRLARAYTKKDMVACSSYHGFHDWYIGTTDNDLGVPEATKNLTKTFLFNDIDTLRRVFDENPDKVAAVILEPCQGDGPDRGFLEKVKEMTHRNGAVLIFDEVVSGFRVGIGGAQGYYGVTPDLSAFGKGMGNGLAISAIVGKTEMMKLIDEGAFVSTTFGGESLGLAGALATIAILERPGSFEHIYKLGNRWKDGVQKLIDTKPLANAVRVHGVAPHCGVVFNDIGRLSRVDLFSIYQENLIRKGILSVGINNFCLAHTDADIDRFIGAVGFALDALRKAIEQDSIAGLLKGQKFRPVFKRN